MKILFIVNQFPSLSETFILDQITGMIDRGNDVEIYALQRNSDVVIHEAVGRYKLLEKTFFRCSIPSSFVQRIAFYIRVSLRHPVLALRALHAKKLGVKFLSIQDYSVGWMLSEIAAFYGRREYDILYSMYGTNGQKAVLFRSMGLLKGKIATTFFGYDMTKCLKVYGDTFYNTLFEHGDIFLPLSEHFKNKLISIGCDEQKIIVHYLGIDLSVFQKRVKQDDSRGKHKVLVSVGRLSEEKGHVYAIEAVQKLKKFHHIHYYLVGDGPLRKKLEQRVRELNLSNDVTFVGPKIQQEVFEFLSKADLFLLPSVIVPNGDEEGTPLSLMEAMAMEIPLVSTQVGGIPELVRENTECLVPQRNSDALAEKISGFLQDSSTARSIATSNKECIHTFHNLEVQNDVLMKLFNNMVNV
ncbi:glycosyltransferase [Candidatus Babeliales bacterium]|nr:glycosyltransferase [Candidatus Babeliales bacterium]